jgi:protein-L-isoaspartate(D-aspartate) O-methyltransferase
MGSGALKKEYLLDDLRELVSEPVIIAMSRVPRELFVPVHLEGRAYDDTPLPIGLNQTISAPHMVAIMCELLDLSSGMKVLEVGGGSGYHAAVMAVLVGPEGHVYSVERKPELVVLARKNLEKAKIANVTMVEANGSLGLPEHAPYDRISVAATAPQIPESLKQQLDVGGKMVLPVGRDRQELLLVTKTDHGFEVEEKMGVVFVPLIGVEGFKEQQI